MIKTIKANFLSKDNDEKYLFGNIDSGFSYSKRYIKCNGKPILPIIGEYHFSRYDNQFWETEIMKIKAQGLDGIAIYVFWNHHEGIKGEFDFKNDNNIKKFLSLCKKYGLQVILRIGPWCHGEVRYGGFPDWLRFMKKRGDYPKYLGYVKRFWTMLYLETKDFFDGKTVIGIQLENEYGGKLEHIVTLRKIAEEIGYKTPFFTMTAWPTNTPDKRFLPMMGGYPEAPWTQHKRPLKNANRFELTSGRTETEIGEDLIKVKRDKADFSDFPYVGCEVGTGNQVTQHRRPIISEKDGYGVAFAKFASGMNWLGYYMYHGGRNPRGKLLQESRRTLYPNNYPIIDYDFQAPISKDGKVRQSGNLLRLLHYFIKFYDNEIGQSDTAFSIEKGIPYISTRFKKDSSGYIFISNYERGEDTKDVNLILELEINKKKINLPKLYIKKEAIFFFPYNFLINSTRVDYLTAQPILKDKNKRYYKKIDGITPIICIKGKETIIDKNYLIDGEEIIVLDNEADKLYYIDEKIIFSDGEVFSKDGKINAEIPYGGSLSACGKVLKYDVKNILGMVNLEECQKKVLPYNYYLYSKGKRSYYKLKIDKKLLEDFYDVKIVLDFIGLNLQVFSGNILIDDYFNTDGKYVLHLKTFKDILLKNNELIIKAVSATKFGVGNVYNEIDIPVGRISLKVEEVIPYLLAKV